MRVTVAQVEEAIILILGIKPGWLLSHPFSSVLNVLD